MVSINNIIKCIMLPMVALWLMAGMAVADGHYPVRVPAPVFGIDVALVQQFDEIVIPAIGNWLVNGRDLRIGTPHMPRRSVTGRGIVMCSLVLFVAFHRYRPGSENDEAMLMGTVAEHIFRRVQPYSTDIESATAIVAKCWEEIRQAIAQDRNYLVRSLLLSASRVPGDPNAPSALTAERVLPIARYLLDYMDNGVDGRVPFPAFMVNPWAEHNAGNHQGPQNPDAPGPQDPILHQH